MLDGLMNEIFNHRVEVLRWFEGGLKVGQEGKVGHEVNQIINPRCLF